jgi:hypothetical protein
MTKDEINEGLFGFLRDMSDEMLKQRTDSLIQEISSTTVTSKSHKYTPKSGTTETIISLEEQLQMAVDAEDYDLAIQLRDEIKKKGKKEKKIS